MAKEQISKKEKKEKRKHRSKDRKEKEQNGDSVETSLPGPEPAGCSDGGSGESCTSYGTESVCSRSTAGGRSARSGAESARSGAESSRGRSRGATSSKKPAPGADAGGVRVLNLADIRGQELPNGLQHGGPKEAPNRGDMSSRSGASEGGRSARSCRSDAQSEGGRSVASVSVKKYMGYLSEQKSPSEVKKMVKDFVRQMVKGRDMGVLCADGSLKPVLCRLSRELDVLKIKAGEQTRKVALGEVERVLHGSEELSDLETPLDECCSTLELTTDGECISFKFPERKASELFTLCLQLFIDGQKQR